MFLVPKYPDSISPVEGIFFSQVPSPFYFLSLIHFFNLFGFMESPYPQIALFFFCGKGVWIFSETAQSILYQCTFFESTGSLILLQQNGI